MISVGDVGLKITYSVQISLCPMKTNGHQGNIRSFAGQEVNSPHKFFPEELKLRVFLFLLEGNLVKLVYFDRCFINCKKSVAAIVL